MELNEKKKWLVAFVYKIQFQRSHRDYNIDYLNQKQEHTGVGKEYE